jgi:SAM-dependent methyltransferase
MQLATNYNAWLLDRARPYLGRRVLDAGAGTGTFTEAVASGRELVVAMEPEPSFARQLRERFEGRPEVVVLETDSDALVPDALPALDSVVCFNVLEHIRDDRAALARFRDVLVGGGHLLLLVPAHPALYGATDRLVEHERRYRKVDVDRLLTEAGFDVVDLGYVNPVGAVGWFVSSRLLRRELLPQGSLKLYDRLVPLLRRLDRLPLPFGLSVWAVARRPAT